MIEMVNIWHHYGIKPILRGVNLQIATGDVVAVMGPNGMGKSTLLGLLAGLLAPIRGHVTIDGQIRRRTEEAEIAIRKKVMYLPDSPYLPLFATGLEYVLALGRLYQVEEDRLLDHAKRLLEIFDLGEQADAPIRSYSTGQKKKISICSALVTEAPILILDEPFSGGLDSSALLSLSRIIKQLAARDDVTIVMAVPVPELVEPLVDKVAVLSHGEIVAYDSPAGLRQKTGCGGSLAEILEKLVHPKTLAKLDMYLSGREK